MGVAALLGLAGVTETVTRTTLTFTATIRDRPLVCRKVLRDIGATRPKLPGKGGDGRESGGQVGEGHREPCGSGSLRYGGPRARDESP